MFIVGILKSSPINAITIVLCLATLWWCARIVRRRLGPDRFLLAVLGLLSACQGARILIHQSAAASIVMQRFDGGVDATIAMLFLVAAVILEISASEHFKTRIQLRLAENQPPQLDLSANGMLEARTQETLRANVVIAWLLQALVQKNGVVRQPDKEKHERPGATR